MSIWTSKTFRFGSRTVLALGLCQLMVACLGPTGGGGGGGGGSLGLLPAPEGKPTDAVHQIAVYRGQVIVTGPAGYCVDPKSVQRRGGSSFALLASCAHLSSASTDDVAAAVITVSVLPRDRRAALPDAREMAAALGPENVVAGENGDGITLVQLARGGDRVVPGGDPRHWRAAIMVGGHLVGLAAYSGPDGAAAGREGRALLIATAEAMLDASPPIRSAAEPQPEATPDNADAPEQIGDKATQPPVGLRSLFGGLFRKPA